jgi:uncharacterized membrane protein
MTAMATATDEQPDGAKADRPRVESIDLLRGLVMVLMVLDHVREYFGSGRIDPTDLASTTPALFFTRWVTHFCAPTFLFLAGVSASLAGARRSRPNLSAHLIGRGIWLIVLEQTFVSVCLFFTYPRFVLGLVFWAIGWSMILLAVLIYLPRAVIGAIGVAMIVGHNLLDEVRPEGGVASLLWGLLHVQGLQLLPGGVPILVGYPLIPWVGVMAAGYALAPVFSLPSGRRRAILFALGIGSIVGFVALRWSNLYGDPRPWTAQASPSFTAMSFLNCRKNPPSLLYLLMTLGPALVVMAAFDRGIGKVGIPLRTIGRVPLFFYLLQWPVAHGLAVVVAAARGYPVGWMFEFPGFQSPPGYGRELWVVYLFWAITVALLYFPSRWYDDAWRRRSARRVAPAHDLT